MTLAERYYPRRKRRKSHISMFQDFIYCRGTIKYQFDYSRIKLFPTNLIELLKELKRENKHLLSKVSYLGNVSLPGAHWQASYAQLSLLCAMANTQRDTGLNHVTMQQLNGAGSYGLWAIFGIGKAAVLTTEVHHKPKLPEWPNSAEQRNQHVLVDIPRNMSDVDFTASSWSWPIPLWW